MMTLQIIGSILAVLGVLYGFWMLFTDKPRVEREPEYWQKYTMRYKGGDAPCVVCGRPTPYTLHGRPIHGECRPAA